MNLAKGASLENTLALDDTGVINPDRQRFADEFVRHKILDAIGDMALAGAPLIARFEGVRSGHGLNNRLLQGAFCRSRQLRNGHASLNRPGLCYKKNPLRTGAARQA